MRLLDCENVESTYNSIKNIFGLEKKTIQNIFKEIDLDKFYDNNPHIYSFEDAIIEIISEKFSIDYSADGVVWFHATRIFENQNFNKGILHLNQVINQVWDNFFNIVQKYIDKKEWNEFRTEFEKNDMNHHSEELYNMKVNDSYHWGPYGFLIRESILYPKQFGNWDYLGSSEIVYDICNSFKYRYKKNIFIDYYYSTSPVIVKFFDTKFNLNYLGIAFYYLYLNFLKEPLNSGINYCYDGEGQTIKTENIISVEKIVDWQSDLLNR